jgi:hypothetical protein
MTDKQIIIDENKINPNDWLEPYKPIPACEIKDCNELVYCGDGILGCRIAEDGLVCDDFNNDDECCMYRQLEYYKEALKRKEQECEAYKMEAEEGKEINAELKAENERLEDLYDRVLQTLKDIEIITQQGIDFFNETERHADWEKVAIFMKQQLSFILGEIEEG